MCQRYCQVIRLAEYLKSPSCCAVICAVFLHWLLTKCWQLQMSYRHIFEDTLFLLVASQSGSS